MASVPFSTWMELVLYDVDWGYYSRRGSEAGFRDLGRGGDFYTSVSVGQTYGFLLAHRLVRDWETVFGGRLPFVVVEQGGHDGQLARDILAGLREIRPELLEGLEYRLVEPRPALRKALAERCGSEGGDPLRIFPSLAEASAPDGVFLCNELLDAFPVDLLFFEKGGWWERQVGWDAKEGRPCFTSRPLRSELANFAAQLGNGFPEGYLTEVCPAVDAWAEEVFRLFERGGWWIVDYGQERADYYLPQRTRGTLRCYRGHRLGEDPFAFPGEQDLTADVDFTRVEEAARRLGLRKRQFTDQHHFLIEAAKPWLLSLEGRSPDAATAKRIRQFQTLTHPSLMGQRFKILELER